MIFRLVSLGFATTLCACNMQAANHEPLIGHATGDDKALAACVFDQRHRDRTDVFTSVNEARYEARICVNFRADLSKLHSIAVTETVTKHLRLER